MELKGRAWHALAVFAKPVGDAHSAGNNPGNRASRAKAEQIWQMLFASRALSPGTGVNVELDNRESLDHEYPGTIGFCTLLRGLLTAGVPVTADFLRHVLPLCPDLVDVNLEYNEAIGGEGAGKSHTRGEGCVCV